MAKSAMPLAYSNPAMKVTKSTDDQKAAEEEMAKFLDKTLRITLLDERTMQGQAICIDGAGNLILQDVTETQVKEIQLANGTKENQVLKNYQRSVIIPFKRIVRVQLAKPEALDEQRGKYTKILDDLRQNAAEAGAETAAAASEEDSKSKETATA